MTLRTMALVVCMAVVTLATAQPVVDNQPPLTVRAAVWGQVASPGQYYLTGTPDLFELLSRAGGPTAGANLGRVTLIREIDGTRRRLDVGRIAASGSPFFILPGDVVIVPESFWSGLTRNLPVISTLAVVANLAVSIALIARQ